jgi:hypothetical protein
VLVHGVWVKGSGWKPVHDMLVKDGYHTDVGNDSKVVGLVYIAAHALDRGETEVGNGKLYPNSTMAVKKTADGFTYLALAHFPADLAARPSEGAGGFRGERAGAHRGFRFHSAGRPSKTTSIG